MMTTSFERQFRVLVPGTEPVGEEISLSVLTRLLQDKVIDKNTQVWDESNKCWLALHHCELTKGLIQNALLQPVAEVAEVTETTEVNNVVPEPDTIQNIETVDTEIAQNIDHQSASLWDAWDESSIRVIVDGEVNSILSSNVP